MATLERKHFVGIGITIVLVILALVPSVYFYLQYRQSKNLLQNPPQAQQEEVKRIVEQVGKLMELPSTESPTVATVADKDRLKDQPFFSSAQNGDKVLIFSSVKKAVLYRPSSNKIVEIAPVAVGDTTTPTPSLPNTAMRVVMLNGTTVPNLTKKYEDEVKKMIPQTVVVDRSNANKDDYAKTLFIDLNGSMRAQADAYAAALGVTVSDLPSGEKKPANADFLIIIGKDKER